MKIYSSDSVSKENLQEAEHRAIQASANIISKVDEKQTRQIKLLRWAVGLSFVVNLGISIVLSMKVFG